MTSITLPPALSVRNLLEDLLGREVSVSLGNPLSSADVHRTVGAVYVDDTTKIAATLGLELPLAAFCGAALGLIPVGGAEDSIKDGKLSELLYENVTELCNVFSSLLNHESERHVKLFRVYSPPAPMPPEGTTLLLALGSRLDLMVDVSRYGKGRLSLSLAW